jgi:hypothetical protein
MVAQLLYNGTAYQTILPVSTNAFESHESLARGGLGHLHAATITILMPYLTFLCQDGRDTNGAS